MSRRDFPAEVLGKVEKLRGSMEKLNGASGVSDMHGNAARAAESETRDWQARRSANLALVLAFPGARVTTRVHNARAQCAGLDYSLSFSVQLVTTVIGTELVHSRGPLTRKRWPSGVTS